ncbi:MAG TPA: HAMP domain-containing sensor histidine kinase [Geobacteraceae bacterium]|nr:HAMP domain-containing sensor histidine kinase [Geobacteraceae bacterium]
MKLLRKLFHPLFALITIQLIWVLLVIFWIYWFIDSHKAFRKLAELYKPEVAGYGIEWPVLVEGLALLLLVLPGVYIIFLYWKRQSDLVEQQKSFMSQVTHELKSPLASIQLHLETIKLRNPPPDKLERFLDTMLADTDRLNNLINNLLLAAKLEHRVRAAQYPVIDFSLFLGKILEQKQSKLPEGGSITIEVEEGIKAAIDTERMETVLRNLFENACLYSPASPEIRVTLKKSGRHCLLTFQDHGKGIEAKELKKIFRMFYRVRRSGENIRGTGLGLYIVKSVVKDHGGKIRVTSEGAGKGTTFLITLPLAK